MPANAPLAGRFEEDPRVHFDKTAGKFQYEDEDTGKEYEWTGQVWVELVSVARPRSLPDAMHLLMRTRWMRSSGRLSKRLTLWPAWTSRSVATQCRKQLSDAAPDARQRGNRQRRAPEQEAQKGPRRKQFERDQQSIRFWQAGPANFCSEEDRRLGDQPPAEHHAGNSRFGLLEGRRPHGR